jgi:DivIVA domain-containing protein
VSGILAPVSDPEPSKTGEKEAAASAEETQPGATKLRSQVPAEIRNVSFPVSVRGYDRRAVDVYVNRVNRVIAELEISRSPQSAVRHAVDRVAEQTKSILQQARESAEKITATAREEGDEIMAGAKAEAANLIVNVSAEADRVKAEAEQILENARNEAAGMLSRSKAESEKIVADSQAEAAEQLRRTEEEIAALQTEAQARMDELHADTEAVRQRRHELVADMGSMGAQLEEVAAAAAARFSSQEPTDRTQEASAEPTPEDATQTDVAAADGSEGAPTRVGRE